MNKPHIKNLQNIDVVYSSSAEVEKKLFKDKNCKHFTVYLGYLLSISLK